MEQDEKDARRAFRRADADNSGALDHEEMRVLATTFGVTDAEQLEDAIAEMDINLDGEISLDEFMAWYKQNLLKGDSKEGGESSAPQHSLFTIH